MLAHARFCYPEEACGLLATDDAGRLRMAYCLTNADRSEHRFTVDPDEHFGALTHAERNGWHIGGAFHSHPGSAAIPSAADTAGSLDPDWIYVITGTSSSHEPELFAYTMRDGRPEAVELEIGELAR